ncbi:MAG: Fe-Mn family superoxide dismutase [Candidatus Moranbacteria bacterium]|nr:Fe-Mn family superoxide dismutase [Candidatus Moranbacteria bacterium]
MSALYTAKDFTHLLGLPGFSDVMLTNHFALYEGYVKNSNLLIDLLETKEPGTPEFSELQRRLGWEWNGMRLHELYFENMTQSPTELTSGALKEKIEKVYGSFENWKKRFTSIAAMRGIGWVILYQDTVSGELFTTWINEHDGGHLSGCVPLLIMDVFEHAYITDYGIKRADYIASFMKVIDWSVVEKRLA